MCWMQELSLQRMTFYSNGLIVQSDDSKRFAQLLGKMKSEYPKPIILPQKRNGNWVRERWLVLDPWEGLMELKQKDDSSWKFNVLKPAKQYGADSMRILLPVASEELEKGNTVLVIHNVLRTDKHLETALRSWATSDEIRRIDSTVIMFTEDMSILSSAVWSKMKIIDVPKSLQEERLQILRDNQSGMALPLIKGDEENAAVRLLAGLSLDQADAVVVESLTRHKKIELNALAKSKEDILGRDPVLDIIQRPKFGFEAIGGYELLKQRLIDDIVLPLKNPSFADAYDTGSPRGVILFGPPGTGKTILTKAMSKELNMSMLVLKQENFMSKYVGESERSLKRAFKTADSMSPCIIFLDELDRLAKRTSGGGGDSGAQVHREIFSMFLEKLGDENRKWFFVGCTNRIEDIDEAMRRTGRIDSIIPVPFPDKEGREEIFRIHSTVKRNFPIDDDVDFSALADAKHTRLWSGSDIEQLVIRTTRHVMKDSIQKGGKPRNVTMADFEFIMDNYNVDIDTNTKLQNETKTQAEKLTNDRRLLNIFEEAETLNAEEVSRGQKLREFKA